MLIVCERKVSDVPPQGQSAIRSLGKGGVHKNSMDKSKISILKHSSRPAHHIFTPRHCQPCQNLAARYGVSGYSVQYGNLQLIPNSVTDGRATTLHSGNFNKFARGSLLIAREFEVFSENLILRES